MMINRNKNTEEYGTYFKNLTCWGNFMSQGCQRLTCSGFFLFVIIFPYHPLYQSFWKKSHYPPKAENFSFPLGFNPARSLLAVTVVLGYQKKVRQPCIGQMKSESSQEAWTGKASLLLMARSQLASVRTLAPLVEAGSYHKSFPLARLDLLVLNSEGGTSIQRKTNHLDSTA